MARAPKKPVKRPTRRATEVRTKIVKFKAEIEPAAPPPKPSGGPLDKALDLVKWVDSPFKLLTIIILGVLGLVGYIVYSHQDKLIASFTARETMPELLADERLSSLSRDLLRDLRAETVIIHQVDLAKNARITRIAQSADGRFAPLEGQKGAFFSGSPARNRAAIAMLNGEVFACRGSIPPEPGHMAGYISVGFKQ
jgi:hypothetical protein